MPYHTERAMKEISEVVSTIYDDKARFYKVNWIIVSTSHDIYKSRGRRGHRGRQNIRHRLWKMTKERHPVMRRYRTPMEITGDSKCRIKFIYRIRDFIRFIFGGE
jgi:hypothetical protein